MSANNLNRLAVIVIFMPTLTFSYQVYAYTQQWLSLIYTRLESTLSVLIWNLFIHIRFFRMTFNSAIRFLCSLFDSLPWPSTTAPSTPSTRGNMFFFISFIFPFISRWLNTRTRSAQIFANKNNKIVVVWLVKRTSKMGIRACIVHNNSLNPKIKSPKNEIYEGIFFVLYLVV